MLLGPLPTIDKIIEYSKTPIREMRTGRRGETAVTPTTNVVYPIRGTPILSISVLTTFCGTLLRFKNLNILTKSTPGKQTYSKFTTASPLTGATKNNDVYHMLISALVKGSGFYIISKVVNDDEHEAWKNIEEWYGCADTSKSIINLY